VKRTQNTRETLKFADGRLIFFAPPRPINCGKGEHSQSDLKKC